MRRALLALALLAATSPALADEGMWPFNMVPKEAIKKEHGLEVTDTWLDRLRLASVRFKRQHEGDDLDGGGWLRALEVLSCGREKRRALAPVRLRLGAAGSAERRGRRGPAGRLPG